MDKDERPEVESANVHILPAPSPVEQELEEYARLRAELGLDISGILAQITYLPRYISNPEMLMIVLL